MNFPTGRFADNGGLNADMARATARLQPYVTWPAWFCAILLIFTARLAPEFLMKAQWIPLAASVLFLGLPHGAWDSCARFAVENRVLSVRAVAVFLAEYASLAAMYGAFWVTFPAAAFAVFLAFSLLHWGQGDAWFARVFYHRSAKSAVEVGVIWLVRGGLPIALPVLAFPRTFASVAQNITERFGLHVHFADLLGPTERKAGFAFLFFLTLVYVGMAWKEWKQRRSTTGRADFVRDAGEVALLWALFGTVNPVAAVGVYFGVWHGARHIARLLLTDTALRKSVASDSVAKALLIWARQAAPIFCAALCLLGGLYWIYAQSVRGMADLIGLYLAFIAALTFPHFVLVLWMDAMDKKQGRFTGSGGRPGAVDASNLMSKTNET